LKNINEILFIVQVRLNSQRVPNKMIRNFAGTTLTDILLQKLVQCKNIPNHQIYLSAHEKELIDIVNKIKEKFDEVQLTNAKLHYTNRVLIDDSLNERQKGKIVESISEVSSIEQAKIVYETLQSTVGTLSEKKEPNSLNEVVSKRNSSSILLHSRKSPEEKKKENNEFADRMKRLAGIN